ncbi:Protein S100-A10 [Heterocephalus glaber]|uniref:Protein S100-A10 n=1 Tax=Heterocephalus glaber TaxID=10181 RepID=G5B5Z0_HETGA|nr:Protein S100-A10 [Heterocephalus glaber]
MPSQTEHAMETMMFTFHKFARDKGYLTKEHLRVLIEKGFPGFLENQKDPLAVDKNHEGPGPVPRRQSGLPELLFTNRRPHRCVQ